MREEVGRIDDLIQQYFWLARLPDLERQPEDLGVYDAFALEMQAFVAARGITLEVEGTRGLGQMCCTTTFRRFTDCSTTPSKRCRTVVYTPMRPAWGSNCALRWVIRLWHASHTAAWALPAFADDESRETRFGPVCGA